VDGLYFPGNKLAAVIPSPGTQLQQQADQLFANGASITKIQAQNAGIAETV
jgi:hypothetical protein